MNQFYDTLVHILKLEVPVYWNYMEKSKINYKKIFSQKHNLVKIFLFAF